MNIEKMLKKYNAYVSEYALRDYKHCLAAERKAAWLQRCADRRGVALDRIVTSQGYMHAGANHPVVFYALRRRMVDLDEG